MKKIAFLGAGRMASAIAGKLEQISRDQTLVQMLYEEGTISVEEKKVHAKLHPDPKSRGQLRCDRGGKQCVQRLYEPHRTEADHRPDKPW